MNKDKLHYFESFRCPDCNEYFGFWADTSYIMSDELKKWEDETKAHAVICTINTTVNLLAKKMGVGNGCA